MVNHPNFEIGKEKDPIYSDLTKESKDSLESIKSIISHERNGYSLFSLLIELIQHIESSLESIKRFIQLTQGKFNDKIFADHFNHIVNSEIEKVDSLLTNVLNYVKVNFTIEKTNTIHTFIEEALKKYQVQLEERKVRVFKKFEKDLPETIVPDEHLKYILNSILQYAVALLPPNGNVGITTRSFNLQKEAVEDHTPFKKEGKYIEILIIFTGYQKPSEKIGIGMQMVPTLKEEKIGLELRLVNEIIKRHQGTMKFVPDETKSRTAIALTFPIERRKVLFYQPVT